MLVTAGSLGPPRRSHALQRVLGNLLLKARTAGSKNKCVFGDAAVLQSRVVCLNVLNGKPSSVVAGHELQRKLPQKSGYSITRLGVAPRFPHPTVSLGLGDGVHRLLEGLAVKQRLRLASPGRQQESLCLPPSVCKFIAQKNNCPSCHLTGVP